MIKLKAHFIIQHYALILIIALITGLIGGYYSSQLQLESDLAELLPETFESVKTFHRIEEEVGGVGNLRIVLESSDFNALKSFAEALEPLLEASPYVSSLDYKNDVAFYKKNALLFLETDELDSLHTAIQDKINSEKQKLNPFFVEDLFGDGADTSSENDLATWESKYKDKEPKEYYINTDSTVLVINVFPAGANTSLKFSQNMFNEVSKIVEAAQPQNYAHDLKVYYGGNLRNRITEYAVVKNDILGTAIYGFGGVLLLIILYFRRFAGAFLIAITLLISLAWTFGLTYWVIGKLNTITGFLFVILFGLGIDYGIHAYARYAESRRNGLSFADSIEKMVSQTGKALATTAITTAAAFFSLILMDFKGFSELGFISGVGILFALVAMVLVLPAFLTLMEKFHWLKFPAFPSSTQNLIGKEFPFSKPILIGAALISLLAIYGASRTSFEYDFTNLRANDEERELVGEKISGIFDRSESPAVVLADSKDEVNEVVAAVKKIMAADTLSPTVEAVKSIYSLVPENQNKKLQIISEIRQLVDEEADGVVKGGDKERLDKLREYLQVERPFTWEEFPEKDKRQFISKSGEIGNFVFIYPSVALRNGKNAIEFRNDIGKITLDSGKTFYASNSNIILAEMLIIMIKEGRLAVLLTFFVVFLILLIDFRHVKATFLVLIPLVLGMLWMVGAMFFVGMKLNFFNIVVLPSVIGIGVDNGVHIYHRYKEEGRRSLVHVLRNTGLAITMTTSTTIVGYSGLILAHHPGLNSIGDLAVIGISATYLAALIVLPAILQFLENRKSIPRPANSTISILE